MNAAVAIQIVQALVTLMIQMPQLMSAGSQIIDEIEKWHNDSHEASNELVAQIRKARRAVIEGAR